jgi:PAS domain S-box-containing protein
MLNKVTLLVCEHFIKEVEASIESEGAGNVAVLAFPASCGRIQSARPMADGAPERPAERPGPITPPLVAAGRGHVVGCWRLARSLDAGSGAKGWTVHKLDQCFQIIAGKELVDRYLSKGFHLVSPGWLLRWRDQIAEWGLDQQTAREFFRESAAGLLLIDTGLHSQTERRFAEFADFVDRPRLTLEVGLAFCRLFVKNLILEEQARLVEKRNKYRQTVFDRAPWAMSILELETGVIESVNPAFAEMHGYEIHELTSVPIENIAAPRSLSGFLSGMEMARQRGHHRYESEHIRKEGSILPVQIDAVPLDDEPGDLKRILIAVRDLTVPKRAEETLRSSEQRYRALTAEYSMALDLLASLTRTTTELEAVRKTVELCTMLFAPGKVFFVAAGDRKSTAVWPPSEASYGSLREDDLAAGFDGNSAWVDTTDGFKLQIRHGEKILGVLFAEGIAFPEYKDRYVGLAGMISDICGLAIHNARTYEDAKAKEKALRDTEESFGKLTENLEEVFWLTESGNPFKIAYLSPSHERVWGYPRRDQYEHQERRLTAIHKDDRDQALMAYTDFVRGAGDYDIEYRIIRPDGTTAWIWDRAFPIRDSRGNVDKIAGLAQDITERKQAEERQQRLIDEIKQFAYIVAHDLRAPLTNLRGFSGEVRIAVDAIRSLLHKALPHISEEDGHKIRSLMDVDLVESVEFIESSVSRMNHLIGGILTLSRHGRSEIRFESLNMNEVVQDVLNTLSHQIHQLGISISISPLPETVADRMAIDRIIGNLLDNAIKFLEPGRPGKIEIRGWSAAREDFFQIKDNGAGIQDADLDRVFHVFQRGTALDVPGDGMGLAYVRTLVRRHGGRIWCESELGKGSTFTFTIARVGLVRSP